MVPPIMSRFVFELGIQEQLTRVTEKPTHLQSQWDNVIIWDREESARFRNLCHTRYQYTGNMDHLHGSLCLYTIRVLMISSCEVLKVCNCRRFKRGDNVLIKQSGA